MLRVLSKIMQTLRMHMTFRGTKLLFELFEIVMFNRFADETNRIFALFFKVLEADVSDTIVHLRALKCFKWPSRNQNNVNLLLFKRFYVDKQ